VSIGHFFVFERTGYVTIVFEVLGGYFFQFWSSYFDHFFTFVSTTLFAGTVSHHTSATLRTSGGVLEFYIVLFASTISTVTGMSLLWKSHNSKKYENMM
jgi:hypothetical protein